MPLANIPYNSGMESFAQTGEPGAHRRILTGRLFRFYYPFAVEFCPGENHVIPKPERYGKTNTLQLPGL